MTSIFLTATTKLFPSTSEIAPKLFVFFFQTQIELFYSKKNIFQKEKIA